MHGDCRQRPANHRVRLGSMVVMTGAEFVMRAASAETGGIGLGPLMQQVVAGTGQL